MKYASLLLVVLLGGCTNVSQMQQKYEAGDQSQLDRLLEIAGRPDYPYATRRKAARVLGEIGDPRAVPVLINVLSEYDQRTTLKQEALVALGKIGDRRAVEPIGRMLDRYLNAHNTELRMAAIETLGDLGGPKSVEILINALKYYDFLALRHEQGVYRGVFSGEEQRFPFDPELADSLRRRERRPGLGAGLKRQVPRVTMFGTPMLEPGSLYDPVPEERALTHAALVRTGEEAVPLIERFLSEQETTRSLRKELISIVEEIRSGKSPADSVETGSGEASDR